MGVTELIPDIFLMPFGQAYYDILKSALSMCEYNPAVVKDKNQHLEIYYGPKYDNSRNIVWYKKDLEEKIIHTSIFYADLFDTFEIVYEVEHKNESYDEEHELVNYKLIHSILQIVYSCVKKNEKHGND